MSGPLRVLAYKPSPEPQTIRMERLITCEPLDLEYLATVLEGHEIFLLDGMVETRDPVVAARHLGAQVVLVTAFITNIDRVLRMAAELRTLPEPPKLFVGGPHAEVMPEHFFADGVDGVFFGDQLRGIAEVVDRIAAGQPFDDVPGGAFPGEEGWTRNPAPPIDPANLPIPRRVLFDDDPDRYYYLYYRRCASVKTAFGCNERCSFCFCTKMHGGGYGPRPMDAVLDELEGIAERNVFILDDNFLSSAGRVREFCDGLRQRGLADSHEYIIYGGAGFVTHHTELLPELRAVGVTGLIVGFESIRATADFIDRTRIPIPRFYILTPMPGTDLYQELKDDGRLLTEDHTRYSGSEAVHRPERIEPEALTEEYWSLYRKVFSWAGILRRTLFNPWFLRRPRLAIFSFVVNLHYRHYVKKRVPPNIF